MAKGARSLQSLRFLGIVMLFFLVLAAVIVYLQKNSYEMSQPYLSDQIRIASQVFEEPFIPQKRVGVDIIRDIDKQKLSRDLEDQLQECTDENTVDLGPMKLSLPVKKLRIDHVKQGKYVPASCRPHSSVAVLIPHKNQSKQVDILVQQLHPLLKAQNLRYGIYVVKQLSPQPLHRGMLLNIGFVEAMSEYHYHCIVLHDVNFVPEDSRLLYKCGERPRYLINRVRNESETVSKLIDKNFALEILSIRSDHYRSAGGMSNVLRSPGYENQDFEVRMKVRRLRTHRVELDFATFVRLSQPQPTPSSQTKMPGIETVRKEMTTDGLVDLQFTLVDKHSDNNLYQSLEVKI